MWNSQALALFSPAKISPAVKAGPQKSRVFSCSDQARNENDNEIMQGYL